MPKDKFGSHGSLTKAGKVRDATPKLDRTTLTRGKNKTPMKRNRSNYMNRVLYPALKEAGLVKKPSKKQNEQVGKGIAKEKRRESKKRKEKVAKR